MVCAWAQMRNVPLLNMELCAAFATKNNQWTDSKLCSDGKVQSTNNRCRQQQMARSFEFSNASLLFKCVSMAFRLLNWIFKKSFNLEVIWLYKTYLNKTKTFSASKLEQTKSKLWKNLAFRMIIDYLQSKKWFSQYKPECPNYFPSKSMFIVAKVTLNVQIIRKISVRQAKCMSCQKSYA